MYSYCLLDEQRLQGREAAGARLRLLVRSDGSSLRIEVAHSYKRNTHKDYKRTHRDVICLDLPTRLHASS